MPKQYILAIDQGTTGTRAILYDSSGEAVTSAYREFHQFFPKPGWVEHDAEEILRSVKVVIGRALRQAKISNRQIHAIGITNQRETIVLWDRLSGKPVARAIVWQDRRTADLCAKLKRTGGEPALRKKTGLFFDPYFSGTKLRWCFDHIPSLKQKARSGRLCFGTIDSWLLFHLTGKAVHATDFTNASRTLLFNIRTKTWDRALCRLFRVPTSILPLARPSNSRFGTTQNFPPLSDGIPIHSILGDQQAALFGQSCYQAGDSKNTYGTGCFMLLNLGKRFVHSRSGLITTLACNAKGEPIYALEGSIFIAGAAIQWLRDGLKMIQTAAETEAMAHQAFQTTDDHVTVIPAFTGLGAPYWRPEIRGAMFGLTRGTSREAIVKATLDAIALQVREVFDLMKRESRVRIQVLKVDGGASRNRYLMQAQADFLGLPVARSTMSELTAWGAAKLAGIASGFWPNSKRLNHKIRYEKFQPRMRSSVRRRILREWQDALRRLLL